MFVGYALYEAVILVFIGLERLFAILPLLFSPSFLAFLRKSRLQILFSATRISSSQKALLPVKGARLH